MNLLIVGSGNIAHALVTIIGSNSDAKISLLTSKPYKWSKIVAYIDNKELLEGKISSMSNEAKDVVSNADIIIFTLPSFARENYLKKIAPFVKENTIIASFPGVSGFNSEVENIISKKNISIVSAQRVPCIARVKELGKSVNITLKDEMKIATNNIATKKIFEKLLSIKIDILDDFMEVNLSNSNPILHTARLYVLLQQSKCFENEIYFYRDWDNESSKILLEMDREFMQIVKSLNLKNIKSLKEHYGVDGIESMTNKIKSIKAFRDIKAPLIKTKRDYCLDTSSRYFSEDVEVGLKYTINKAKELNIKVTKLKEVYNFLTNILKESKSEY